MKGRITLLLYMPVLPLLGGCLDTSGTGSSESPPIETDATSYALRERSGGLETDISIRFENQTRKTIYIANCRGGLNPGLWKQVDDGWELYWSPVLLLCSSPSIVIEPGGELVRDLSIWGALPGRDAGPAFKSGDVEGVYRIVLGSMTFGCQDHDSESGSCELLEVPVEYRVSNLFFLDDPRT
jgi:hypothetical protein